MMYHRKERINININEYDGYDEDENDNDNKSPKKTQIRETKIENRKQPPSKTDTLINIHENTTYSKSTFLG